MPELELLKLRGDRVGVFEEMQNRSRRLRAPFVGVSIETGDSWNRIGFCGVCGIDCVLLECRWGKGLIGLAIIAAEKRAETASLSPSLCATFLFLSLVEWVIAMVT
jgi:hypothetical protein